MDFFQLLQPDSLPIDIVMIILVLLSGLFQKKYLSDIKINGAWLTLIISCVFCVIYGSLFFIAYGIEKNMLLRWFFSYVLATSLYELLFKKFILKFFPEEENPSSK